MEETKRHIIWQDAVYENRDEWEHEYDFYLKECEACGQKSDYADLDDYVSTIVNNYLDDERSNLNIPVPEGIIVFGELGLWNGTKYGYYPHELHNVNECLNGHCGGYLKFFVEDGNFMATESHHDGTNTYYFRKWKEGVTEDQKESLRIAILGHDEDRAAEFIDGYTESLAPAISNVYGW